MGNSFFRLVFTVYIGLISSSLAIAEPGPTWDNIDQNVAQITIQDRVSEEERLQFEEILNTGKHGNTEVAIKTLTEFLKLNRNSAFAGLSREVYAMLIAQRKDKTANYQSITRNTNNCPMELKACPNGKMVGRTGLNCEFSPCGY
jgi:hypothetical protein